MTVRVAIANDGHVVSLTWPDGVRRDFAARWLFDHADGARDAVSGQRGHGALALKGGARVETAEIDGDVLTLRFSPSGKRRRMGLSRLRADPSTARPASLWLRPDPIAMAAPILFTD
jgi:hypothetical protein